MNPARWLIPATTILFATTLPAQDATPPVSHLARARELAGADWGVTERLQCHEIPAGGERRPGSVDDAATPTRLFDNVYYVGSKGAGAWAVTAGDSIILIDAMFTRSVKSILLPGLRKFNLDPARIAYVVVTHAGGESFGGAKYLQDTYGSRVIVSATDWTTVLAGEGLQARPERSSSSGRGQGSGAGGSGGGGGGGGRGFGGGRGGGGFGGGRGGGRGGSRGAAPQGESRDEHKTAAADDIPHRDMVGADRQELTVGPLTLTLFLTPAHTPGTLSLLIPVKDHGVSHIAALFGGTGIPEGRDQIAAYVNSAAAFATAAAQVGADVELSSRPDVDDGIARMELLRHRKGDTPNPFLVGQAGVQRYLGVLGECAALAGVR